MPARPTGQRRDEHLKPINVSPEIWMYAERNGLCVVRHRNSTGDPDPFYLPWRKVKRALEIAPVQRRKKTKVRK